MSRFAGVLIVFVFLFSVDATSAEERMPPQNCTYEMQSWSVILKRSVGVKTVQHLYREITAEEIDPVTGCTVCREDQESISVSPLAPFLLCYRIASQVRGTLEGLVRDGAPIITVIGYHVLKSRGPVNSAGNRTEFSNHSFGTAIDINPELNGLYDQCLQFGPGCRLIRGGAWRPGVSGTLEHDSDIVRAFKSRGLRWGGEIEGRQKDFMHFSPTGY
jgi:hypothetical protein